MTARPIIFSGPMVRALIAGTKTQTRRVMKPQPPTECSIHYMLGDESWVPASQRTPLRHHWEAWRGPLYHARPERALAGSFEAKMPCKSGDMLWVRETWAKLTDLTHNDPGSQALCDGCFYRADGGTVDSEIPRWRSSIHMPRWASRLTLAVTEVRVRRLQDISEEDARAEGVQGYASGSANILTGQIGAIGAFSHLWNSIHGPDGWAANPWVCAVSFAVHLANVDTLTPRDPS